MGSNRNHPWIKWLVGGIAAGVAFAWVFAWSLHATDQRQFCVSCHVMQEAAITHKLGTHANLSCNDCHAPHNLMAKLPFKAQAGVVDFVANMSGADVPYPVSQKNRDAINQNCIACHARTNMNVASMDAKPYCVDCHRNIAHMRFQPVSSRTVAYD